MNAEDFGVAVRVALRTGDWGAIEALRGPLAFECLDELVAEYQAATEWAPRMMLIFLLQDRRDPRSLQVMRHALEVPETGDDLADDVRIIAVSHLENRKARELRADRALLDERVKVLRGLNG